MPPTQTYSSDAPAEFFPDADDDAAEEDDSDEEEEE